MSYKRGQIGIFIIMGIIIVAGIGAFFIINSQMQKNPEKNEIEKLFERYSDCIREETRLGASIAGSQGGYIYTEDYEDGSELSPTGSQLNFLGRPVIYWNYVSGNGINIEKKPERQKIESEMERF